MYDFAGLLVEHNRFEQVLHWITLTTLPLALTENQKKKIKGKTQKIIFYNTLTHSLSSKEVTAVPAS